MFSLNPGYVENYSKEAADLLSSINSQSYFMLQMLIVMLLISFISKHYSLFRVL